MDLETLRREYRHRRTMTKHQRLGTLVSSSKMKARKNARKTMVLSMLQAGKTKEEVCVETGLSRSTINLYLRT